VAGVEEGLLPHERSLKENSLDEERRLFYVAMTRAKRHLTLFEAHARVKHGRERMSVTSRFMEDIPAELFTKRIHAARDMVEARVDPNKGQKKPRRKPARRR
jgi:superfamily I DNA/RNA helicase